MAKKDQMRTRYIEFAMLLYNALSEKQRKTLHQHIDTEELLETMHEFLVDTIDEYDGILAKLGIAEKSVPVSAINMVVDPDVLGEEIATSKIGQKYQAEIDKNDDIAIAEEIRYRGGDFRKNGRCSEFH